MTLKGVKKGEIKISTELNDELASGCQKSSVKQVNTQVQYKVSAKKPSYLVFHKKHF